MTEQKRSPRKVLLKLTDEEWNLLRAAAVGRHGWNAGTLATFLVLQYLELPTDEALEAVRPDLRPAVIAGQTNLVDAIETAQAGRKRAPRPKKETKGGRRTRK